MDDEVSGGAPPRVRPPWFRPLVAAAGVGLVAYGVVGLVRGPPKATPPPVPSPASATTTPAPTPTGPQLNGLTGRLPATTELVVGGQHPAVIGGATQWLDHLPVRGDQAVTGAFVVTGGVVVQVRFLELSAEGPSSRFYLVRKDGSYVFLGAADTAVASADQHEVYALRVARPRAAGSLAEVSLDGTVVRRTPVPNGLQIWSDSSAGLLVTSDPEPGNEYADLHLVDPKTLVSTRDLGQVSYVDSATSRFVAWQPTACIARCGIVVADLTSHAAPLRVTQVSGYSVGAVAISPDGHSVAVSWLTGSAGPGPGFVEVVNVGTGVRSTVPGVATAAQQVADLAWTPDSRSLAVGVELAGDVRRVGVWSLAGGPVQVLADRFVEPEDSLSTLLAL
jgi:hypothetical protein